MMGGGACAVREVSHETDALFWAVGMLGGGACAVREVSHETDALFWAVGMLGGGACAVLVPHTPWFHQKPGALWERFTMSQGRRKRPHPASKPPPPLRQRHLASDSWWNHTP